MDRLTRFTLAATLALSCILTGCDSAQTKLRKQGVAEYNAGQYDASFKTFSQGLDHNQFKAVDNYYAGASAMKLEKYETAVYHLKLAWQADPSMSEVKDALLECLLRQGHEDLALDFLERDAALTAKVKDPRPLKQVNNRPYTHAIDERMYLGKGSDRLRVAKSYESIGDFDNARLNYNKALVLDPNSPDVHFAIGKYYERIGNKTSAGNEYTRVYELDPKYPEIVPTLARVGLQPM